MMTFSADVVLEERFTIASLFEPSSRTTTTTAATVTATKARLSSCSSMALPIANSSQNGKTVDVIASPSNTTNNSASNSISSVKNILPTPEKKTSTRKRKTKSSVHLTLDQNLEETRNKKPFPNNDTTKNQWSKSLIGTMAEDRLIITKYRKQRTKNVVSAS
jgi:hypothetical protein